MVGDCHKPDIAPFSFRDDLFYWKRAVGASFGVNVQVYFQLQPLGVNINIRFSDSPEIC
jgi:hypothetical protein